MFTINTLMCLCVREWRIKMNLAAVSHKVKDNECYPLNQDELMICLRTGKDVEAVSLYVGDPFDGGILGGNWEWHGERQTVSFRKELPLHYIWNIVVKPPYKRCKYYFELAAENEKIYYFENGFFTEEELKIAYHQASGFCFPWMNPADINETPAWVNDTVWYQIFPERFCNGCSENDPSPVQKWESRKVTNEEFFGGDLQGVIQKLDYLQKLGITGLYLTPIFASPSAHKYDTTDYTQIDPHFGDHHVMQTLVQEAHKRGMRVMLDGVFNHCGKDFFAWKDVLEKGRSSAFADWFMINRWPFDAETPDTHHGDYYTFGFTNMMPKLNANHPEVRRYLLEVVTDWIRNYDIDGLRLDVANELSHTFCKQLRRSVKNLKKDFYLLGEIWNDSMTWLRGDEFDSVMNYPLASSIDRFFQGSLRDAKRFEQNINEHYSMYMQQTNDVLFNLLDSHDTNRLMDKTGNEDVFFQELALLMAMPGSPCIFYGTEIGMEGGHDPDCRRCMPWQEIEQGEYQTRIDTVRNLIALRKQQTMKSRHFHFFYHQDTPEILHLIKTDEDGAHMEILVNASQQKFVWKPLGKLVFSRNCEGLAVHPGGICMQQVSAVKNDI